MPKFVKRPVTVEAVRITEPMEVKTLEGVMQGNVGDFLITGVKGEQYFCRPDVFFETYDYAQNDAEAWITMAKLRSEIKGNMVVSSKPIS